MLLRHRAETLVLSHSVFENGEEEEEEEIRVRLRWKEGMWDGRNGKERTTGVKGERGEKRRRKRGGEQKNSATRRSAGPRDNALSCAIAPRGARLGV